MELLDYNTIAQNPKIFVGYSDITSFHLAFHSLCNLVTFHGPMVSSNMTEHFDYYSRSSLERTLQMPPFHIFHNPEGYYYKTIVPGIATGQILGGCLSLVSPSIGTFYQPDFSDSILFLEDIDESIPRCDKLMYHLKNAGIFSKVNGVILGSFLNCTNPADPDYTIYDFFCDFFKDFEKPVLWGLQSGHEKPMGTIPLGEICIMNTYTNRVVFERHN
jgi:muramoyltetrapeptide carboxypeptidase